MKKIQEGEQVLQERMKLLMFADTEGWSAANIYAGKVDVGSNSEDERRMRSAAKEAKASRVTSTEKVGTGKRFRSGRVSEPGSGAAVATHPATVTSSQPAQQFRELLCWGWGGKGHMQRTYPRQQRGEGANPTVGFGPVRQALS